MAQEKVKILTKANTINAYLDSFERSYLQILEKNEDFDIEERDNALYVFYGIQKMMKSLINDIEEL